MVTPRKLRFVSAQSAWLMFNVLLLSLVGSITLELFFISSFIGFLAITTLTAPFSVTPPWRARLRWLIALGLLGFGYIAIRRILSLLPPEVL